MADRSGEPSVLVDVNDGVGTIALNRPHRLNALTFEVLEQLYDAVTAFGGRSDVHAVVLRGEGRAFCSGLDLDEGIGDPARRDPIERIEDGLQVGLRFVSALRSIPQPIIAAVQGHAVGAGFAFAAAADVRFVGRDATFSVPFLKIGMSVGDLGLSWFLPRIVGVARANELFYSAGALDAEQAIDWGLATRISPDPFDEARAFARRIVDFPRYGVRASKRLINSSTSSSLHDHLESEVRAQALGSLTSSAKEAMAAVLAPSSASAASAENRLPTNGGPE